MKRIFITSLTLILVNTTAQVLIDDTNSGDQVPNPSAILELRSKDKGFLPPRLTKAQRQNIQNPAKGLMIYLVEEDVQCLQVYDGIEWADIYCPTHNNAPQAQNVVILGVPTIGTVLQGSYTYSDTENDTEGNTIFNWYITDDAQGSNPISLNNNTQSYTIKAKDLHKYIVFSVTPYANYGVEKGEVQYSGYIGPITESVTPPLINTSININEFHYDNVGHDTNEFVEVRVAKNEIPFGIDNYKIFLYNGKNGRSYENVLFNTLIKSCDSNYCYYVWEPASIQNGGREPDGIALINDTDKTIEFISYDGVFKAIDGPAEGITSVDIGVAQSNNTPENSSVYLNQYGIWKLSNGSHTKGTANF